MKPAVKDFLWMAAGAVLLLAIMSLVLHVSKEQTPSAQLALQARQLELVERMRLALASASEAEKSAVMAITDQDSKTFADQARAATANVREERKSLDELLETGGSRREQDLLAQFSKDFADCERIDGDLLGLAVQNTNLKAYSLAFGPAAEALKQMDVALSRLVADSPNSTSPDDQKVILLAFGARIAALSIQTLLPPHIAEESDQKMDELESLMDKEDREVRKDLAGLAEIQRLSGNPDLETASSRYARFTEIKAQILKLSRANTNVRSLAISLHQKRKIMLVCQDDLAALQQAIKLEPIAGVTDHVPVSPR